MSGSGSGFVWQYLDAAGQPMTGEAGTSVSFPTQADAEAWFAEEWEQLTDLGVAQVTLLRDSVVVYGPMPLSA